MNVRSSRGIGRTKEDRAALDALIVKRKIADPDLSPLDLARRFGVAADHVRDVLEAAGLYQRAKPRRPT